MGYYPYKCQRCRETIYRNRYDGEPIEFHDDLDECIDALASRIDELATMVEKAQER